jgi:hypothetical protein
MTSPWSLPAVFDSQPLIERFHRGEYAAVMTDIDAAWETAHAEASRQIEAGEEPWVLVECLRIALLESGMRSWAATRTPSIVARAVELGLWTPERALALAELIPAEKENEAVDLMSAVIGTGKLAPDAANAAIDRAHALLEQLGFMTSFETHFVKLSQSAAVYSRADVAEAALNAALTSADGRYTSNTPALYELMPILPESLFDTALTGITGIKNNEAKLWALGELAPRLSGTLWEKAQSVGVAAAEAMLTEREGIPEMPEHLRPRQDINIANGMLHLGPHLNGEFVERALVVGLKFEERDWFPRVVQGLARNLTPEQWERVVDHTLTIDGEWWRADALMLAVQYARGDAQRKAVESLARTVDDETAGKIRAWAEREGTSIIEAEALRERLEARIREASPRRQTNPVDQFRDVVQNEKDEEERARALQYLAPQLPDDLLPEFIDQVLALTEHPIYREWIFRPVIKRLDEADVAHILHSRFDHVVDAPYGGSTALETLMHLVKWELQSPVKQIAINHVLDRSLSFQSVQAREILLALHIIPFLGDDDVWREIQARIKELQISEIRPVATQDRVDKPRFEKEVQADTSYKLELLSEIDIYRRELKSSVLSCCLDFKSPYFSPVFIAAIANEIIASDGLGLGDFHPT